MRSSYLHLATFFLPLVVIGQDYEIKLHQPVQAGLRYQLSVTAKESRTMTLTEGESVIRTNRESISVEYESVVTVLDVFPNGKPSREKHVVQSLTFSEAETKEQLLTNGTTLVASRRDNKPTFEIDGRSVEMRVYKALASVAAAGEAEPTKDDLFGTKVRRKVGEPWSINKELHAEQSKANGLRLKDLSGSVTLKKVIKGGDTDTFWITARVLAKPFPSLPDGFWLKEGNVTLDMSGEFPVDLVKGKLYETLDMNMNVVALARPRPPNYLEIQLRISDTRSKTCKMVVIK